MIREVQPARTRARRALSWATGPGYWPALCAAAALWTSALYLLTTFAQP